VTPRAPARRSRSPLTARVPVGPQSIWLGQVVLGRFRLAVARSHGPDWVCGRRCLKALRIAAPRLRHRGLRRRRCRAERTIGDRTYVVADGELTAHGSPELVKHALYIAEVGISRNTADDMPTGCYAAGFRTAAPRAP
jgi:hypothetical protein